MLSISVDTGHMQAQSHTWLADGVKLQNLCQTEHAGPSSPEPIFGVECFPVTFLKGGEQTAGLITQWPPLIRFAQSGNVSALRVLLESGVDVNVEGPDHRTALDQAALVGKWGIVQLLLNQGARTSCHPDTGLSPLCYATLGGDVQCFQILLQHKAELTASPVPPGMCEDQVNNRPPPIFHHLVNAVCHGHVMLMQYILSTLDKPPHLSGRCYLWLLKAAISSSQYGAAQALVQHVVAIASNKLKEPGASEEAMSCNNSLDAGWLDTFYDESLGPGLAACIKENILKLGSNDRKSCLCSTELLLKGLTDTLPSMANIIDDSQVTLKLLEEMGTWFSGKGGEGEATRNESRAPSRSYEAFHQRKDGQTGHTASSNIRSSLSPRAASSLGYDSAGWRSVSPGMWESSMPDEHYGGSAERAQEGMHAGPSAWTQPGSTGTQDEEEFVPMKLKPVVWVNKGVERVIHVVDLADLDSLGGGVEEEAGAASTSSSAASLQTKPPAHQHTLRGSQMPTGADAQDQEGFQLKLKPVVVMKGGVEQIVHVVEDNTSDVAVTSLPPLTGAAVTPPGVEPGAFADSTTYSALPVGAEESQGTGGVYLSQGMYPASSGGTPLGLQYLPYNSSGHMAPVSSLSVMNSSPVVWPMTPGPRASVVQYVPMGVQGSMSTPNNGGSCMMMGGQPLGPMQVVPVGPQQSYLSYYGEGAQVTEYP